MSIARIIRAAALRAVPWKNGGGTTREIAVHPPGAGMDDFLWRLSMARVDAAGPFSRFEGTDRVLAVLEGALRLSGPDWSVELSADSPPFAFDGAAPVMGAPLTGTMLDLNAMARRGRCTIHMARLRAGEMAACAGTSIVLALEPQQLAGEALGRLDCALLSAPVVMGGAGIAIGFADEVD